MPTVITKDASMPEIRSPQSPRGAGKEEHQHNGLPKGPEKQSLDYALRSGAAGGLAGCVAKTVVAPLDRVKILFQASNPQFAKYSGSSFGVATAMRDIYRQDGVWGLFRGHSATLLRIFPYASIKFLAYEQVRAIFIRSREQETPLRRLVSGSLAGVTSVFVTYPLEVIRVRLAFETRRDSHSTLKDICRRIYHEQPVSKGPAAGASSAAAAIESATVLPPTVRHATASAALTLNQAVPRSGLVNFYRGFSSTLLGMVPYAGTSFLTHDIACDLLRHPVIARYTTQPKRPAGYPAHKPKPLRSWAELAAGGIAGLVGQTCSYPLEVIRRRMQVGGAVGDGHRLRIAETAGLIWRERGVRGFFVGLTIGYVKMVPMTAVSFFCYERFKTMFGI